MNALSCGPEFLIRAKNLYTQLLTIINVYVKMQITLLIVLEVMVWMLFFSLMEGN